MSFSKGVDPSHGEEYHNASQGSATQGRDKYSDRTGMRMNKMLRLMSRCVCARAAVTCVCGGLLHAGTGLGRHKRTVCTLLAMAVLLAVGAGCLSWRAEVWGAEMRSVPITVALAKPGGAEITFALKQPGQVSMAVYGADERLLRTLLSARPLGVGRHTVHWDGLDRDGVAHPPGDYTVKLLKTDGLRSHLLAQVGINPVPFWEEGVGNHSPTAAVAVDAEGVVLVSNIMEGGFAIAKARSDRSYVWVGIDNHMEMFKQNFVQAGRNATKRILNFISWGYNPCASATVDGVTYILHNTGTVHRTDAHTGRMMDDLFSVQWNDGPDEIDRGGVQIGLGYMDMDACGDTMVVSYRRHDVVRWYDLKTLSLKTEVKVKEPLGVALGAAGDAFVVTGGAIVRIQDGRVSPFVPADALEAPWRLSLDRKTGELLVAENSDATGAANPHHQVKRFGPTAQLLQTLGPPKGAATDSTCRRTSRISLTSPPTARAGSTLRSPMPHQFGLPGSPATAGC